MHITSVKPILLSAPYGSTFDKELQPDYPTGKRLSCFVVETCVTANIHAAFAAGARMTEFPMLSNPLRDDMYIEPGQIVDGELQKIHPARFGNKTYQ